MQKTSILIGTAVASLSLFGASFAFASSGVSVNTGKIVLDKAIIPGATYDLPPIEVKNIGDDVSKYEMSVQFNEVQSQIKPDSDWFNFSPKSFELKPGESKIVKSTIVTSAEARPGEYFAYIEAGAVKGPDSGVVSGAAASKLYFSIASTSMFKATFYSMLSVVHSNSPWSYVFLWIVGIFLLVMLGKKLKHAKNLVSKKDTKLN